MKHFLLIIIAVVLIFPSSCKDPLQIADPNWLEEENFYQTEAHAFLGLVGIYDAFQSKGLMGKNYREFDIITDNGSFGNGQEWIPLESDTHIPSNAKVTTFWTDYYVIVTRANRVIDRVAAMPDAVFSLHSKSRILAEAAFLRAYAFYDLTAIWGNVPFYFKPKNAYDLPESPKSKAEIHAYIINELRTSVIPELPLIVPPSEAGRVSRAAAQALLGKYYLIAEDWQKAADTFGGIIQTEQYDLYPDYAELFTEKGEFSKEILFEINFTGRGMDAGESFSTRIDTLQVLTWPARQLVPITNLTDSYLCTDGRPIADHSLYGAKSPSYVSGPDNVNTNTTRFKDRDPRLRASVYTFMDKKADGTRLWAGNNVSHFAMKKYSVLSSQQYENGGPQNYYVIRYADVLLMYAEAKNEIFPAHDSVYYAVNKIRDRVGMPHYPAGLSQENMRQRIRDERRWEFAFEHQRFFDLKRWKDINGEPLLLTLPAEALPGVKKATTPRVYTWPYPQDEIDRNQALREYGQNAGYF